MASELAKLAAYAGSESVIRREDVLELVPDQAGEDLFALSNALEGRDGAALTRVLDDELEARSTSAQDPGRLGERCAWLAADTCRAFLAPGAPRSG